jgi:hypothetical protein
VITRRIARPATIFLVLALMLVPVAYAAKGGNTGGGGGSTGARITFDPATAVVGQQYQVHGTGFAPNTWETVGAYYSDTTWWASAVTDGNGNFTVSFSATSAGKVLHEAKEQGNSGRLRLRASAYLTVNPAP